jgi:hypothetical protein
MSSNEIVLALSNEVERNERYLAPSNVTQAGQVDRRHEREHVLAIRDAERGLRERLAMAAAEAAADVAWIQGRAQVNIEAKFAIDRAEKLSAVVAGDNPVSQAKFAILDDEFFAQTRNIANRSLPFGDRLFPS